jgi:acyl-CoA synthetase (AMP-forming)/AMP-acid ligase II
MDAERGTLEGLLERAAGRADAGLRFLDRAEQSSWLSWSDLLRRAQRVRGALQAAGIRPGDRVALVYPTSPGFFDAFLGTSLSGAIPVPLYPPVRLGRLDEYHRRTARMIELVGARLVLADRRVRRILGRSMEQARPALGCRTLDELPATDGGVPVSIDADDLGLIQFSSGTTVDPKPVALTHRALVVQAELLGSYWPDGNGTRHSGASWLPLYHDMGLVGCVFPALERPTTLTLIPPELFLARPALWLRAISRYGATVSPAPNFAYGLCVSKIRDEELEDVDLSSWRFALNGAEPVAPTVLRAFENRFARWGFRPEAMTPVYGMSEAALAVTFSDTRRPFRSTRFSREALAGRDEALLDSNGIELVSVGRPLPGFRLRVVDEAGRDLPEGAVGRVFLRGPTLMRGYFGQPEATARAMPGGWLDSGDLGFLHEGELFLTSRAKDLLILRGRNHAPEEVERTVNDVPGVRTGCAVAVSYLPEGDDGEVLLLFVETRNGVERTDRDAIGEACRKAVLAATGLAVDRVLVLDAGTLPRTSSGKLRRRETLQRHLAGRLTPPGPVTALRMAGAVARSRLAYARMRWNSLGLSTES